MTSFPDVKHQVSKATCHVFRAQQVLQYTKAGIDERSKWLDLRIIETIAPLIPDRSPASLLHLERIAARAGISEGFFQGCSERLDDCNEHRRGTVAAFEGRLGTEGEIRGEWLRCQNRVDDVGEKLDKLIENNKALEEAMAPVLACNAAPDNEEITLEGLPSILASVNSPQWWRRPDLWKARRAISETEKRSGMTIEDALRSYGDYVAQWDEMSAELASAVEKQQEWQGLMEALNSLRDSVMSEPDIMDAFHSVICGYLQGDSGFLNAFAAEIPELGGRDRDVTLLRMFAMEKEILTKLDAGISGVAMPAVKELAERLRMSDERLAHEKSVPGMTADLEGTALDRACAASLLAAFSARETLEAVRHLSMICFPKGNAFVDPEPGRQDVSSRAREFVNDFCSRTGEAGESSMRQAAAAYIIGYGVDPAYVDGLLHLEEATRNALGLGTMSGQKTDQEKLDTLMRHGVTFENGDRHDLAQLLLNRDTFVRGWCLRPSRGGPGGC